MLASITPFGERSRGFSWSRTIVAFAVGAVGAGGLGGALLGEIGRLFSGGRAWRDGLALAALAAVVVVDLTPLRDRLPSSRRQVNEDWLGRYRGWVYGLAFGAQLGLGVATIVTSAAVYAAPLIALASSQPWSGALIGGSFGAARALSLLAARGARDPAGLATLHLRLARLEQPVRRGVVVLELITLAIVVGWVG